MLSTNSYQSIDGIEALEASSPQVMIYQKKESSHFMMRIIIAFAVTFLLTFTSIVHYSRLKSTFVCSDECTFAECTASMCQSTAFLCSSGAALNGCVSSETYWPSTSVCSSCCNMVNCAEVLANPDNAASCLPCTVSQCESLASVSNQRCGPTAPYVCLAGSSKMGCNANKYYWASMQNSQCRHRNSFALHYSYTILYY